MDNKRREEIIVMMVNKFKENGHGDYYARLTMTSIGMDFGADDEMINEALGIVRQEKKN